MDGREDEWRAFTDHLRCDNVCRGRGCVWDGRESDLAHFFVCSAVGGRRVCADGNEEGKREAKERSLSGGIKALLQWWKGQL